MDLHPFDLQADAPEPTSRPGSRCIFTYNHPQYQPGYPVFQDDQYASFTSDDCGCLGELARYPSSTSSYTSFDPSGGYVALNTLGSEHDQFFVQRTVIVPPGNMSTYSELMPHVVALRTTVLLKQDVRVATDPQQCVSPALCQGHADLPECAEIDDELDCPGEPASDGEFFDEEDNDHSHPPPPPSPCSTPPPSPYHSSYSHCRESPCTSRVVRSARAQNRYSPMTVKAPSSQKRKSVIKRIARGLDGEGPKKPKKREVVSLACYFCRKRKIACLQPPEGSLNQTCDQCKMRGMECEYPTESRRRGRRGPATSCKHTH